jgi:large subunit ribosomal protein L23
MSDRRGIIKGPVITEKAGGGAGEGGRYAFAVDIRANKIEIRKAVETAFKVKVVKVNTITMRGKLKRVRWQVGKTPDWKKAIVTLREGDTIEYAT